MENLPSKRISRSTESLSMESAAIAAIVLAVAACSSEVNIQEGAGGQGGASVNSVTSSSSTGGGEGGGDCDRLIIEFSGPDAAPIPKAEQDVEVYCTTFENGCAEHNFNAISVQNIGNALFPTDFDYVSISNKTINQQIWPGLSYDPDKKIFTLGYQNAEILLPYQTTEYCFKINVTPGAVSGHTIVLSLKNPQADVDTDAPIPDNTSKTGNEFTIVD